MAVNPMTTVTFDGKSYDVPKDLLTADAQNGTSLTKQYIEDQIAEKTLRVQATQQRKQQTVERGFESVKSRLSDLESKNQVIGNLEQENASLKATNEALVARVAALEDSGGVLGGANASARQTSFELSNAATAGASVLAQMQAEQQRLEDIIERMQVQLDTLQDQFDDQATKALQAGQSRQRLEQEQSVRLLDDVAKADAVARKAEAVAAEALASAQASSRINDGSMTRSQLVAIVQAEVQASTPGTVELAVAQIRDQFPAGLGGPRLDGDYVKQQKSDAIGFVEKATRKPKRK